MSVLLSCSCLAVTVNVRQAVVSCVPVAFCRPTKLPVEKGLTAGAAMFSS